LGMCTSEARHARHHNPHYVLIPCQKDGRSRGL
jgi:hypothetical protein